MTRAILLLPDRQYLEQVILPALASLSPQRVVDIGVEWYTQSHGCGFPADCEYWTLDMRPEVACYGSEGRHIIGNALEIDTFFAPGSLDVVLLNGLFGFGINQVSDQERTIRALRVVLRTGGRLLVGWDRGQGPIKDPLELESIQRYFAHLPPPGLSSRVTLPGSSHIYDWFVAR
jgi:hypothetical protein